MSFEAKAVVLLIAGLMLATAATVAAQQTPVQIGSRLELFVDDYIIDRMDRAELELHHPMPAGPAITFDKPWEGAFTGYQTVIKDGDLYRFYYRGYPEVGDHAGQVTCYAESRDGKTFTKPNLGLYEIYGTKDNNVILAHADPMTHNFAPFLDTRPGVPADERYKALGGSLKSGLMAYVSGDGIHWRPLRDEPVITEGAFDSQNVAFWSENEGMYLCYFRVFTESGGTNYRSISRTTSSDFVNWTPPQEMGYGDTPREQLYTNQTHPYFRAPHIYLSTPMRFMPGRKVMTDEQIKKMDVVGKYGGDCADVVLMTTRGGYVYSRTFMEGFIRPGLDPGNWASRSAMAACNIVPTGPAEMSVYKQMHYAQPSTYMERYTLRTDGFVSVSAPYEGGEMVTKPLVFSGGRLVINFETSAAGGIQVEIQDVNGNPLPGYGLIDAVETIGDDIERSVVWPIGSDLSGMAGKPVRLRFVMRDADLYSIRFK